MLFRSFNDAHIKNEPLCIKARGQFFYHFLLKFISDLGKERSLFYEYDLTISYARR